MIYLISADLLLKKDVELKTDLANANPERISRADPKKYLNSDHLESNAAPFVDAFKRIAAKRCSQFAIVLVADNKNYNAHQNAFDSFISMSFGFDTLGVCLKTTSQIADYAADDQDVLIADNQNLIDVWKKSNGRAILMNNCNQMPELYI
jgi:hypothetical protein